MLHTQWQKIDNYHGILGCILHNNLDSLRLFIMYYWYKQCMLSSRWLFLDPRFFQQSAKSLNLVLFSTVPSGPQFLSISIVFIGLTPSRMGRSVCVCVCVCVCIFWGNVLFWISFKSVSQNGLCVCLDFPLFLKNDCLISQGCPFRVLFCSFLCIINVPLFLENHSNFFSTSFARIFLLLLFLFIKICWNCFFYNFITHNHWIIHNTC